MSVLAIDLGTKTGWALRDGEATITGTLNLKGGRFEGGGMRFLRFKTWLTELLARTPITEVVFEEVRAHKGTDAAHIYGGLMATLVTFCEEHSIPYEGVPVAHIKKFITGKGNAGKAAVMAAVKKAGFSPLDDNEADATALLLLRVAGSEVSFLA